MLFPRLFPDFGPAVKARHASGDQRSIERRVVGSTKPKKIRLDDLVDGAVAIARSHSALHWELAFPEVFCADRPGFNVVLGNPPWEEITVERLGFFARYIHGIKSWRPRDQTVEIDAYVKRHPDVETVYQRELADKEQVRQLIHANFAFSRGGDPDLYRAFAELAIRISRVDGAIGMVYPRMLLAADGSKLYRTALFPQARIVADFALNRRGWIFPDAHPQYTIVALAAGKGGTGEVAQAGPAVDESAGRCCRICAPIGSTLSSRGFPRAPSSHSLTASRSRHFTQR